MNKIQVDKRFLNLVKLTLDDTFETAIEKINKNNSEIQVNGGGPSGPVGPQGEAIPGRPGPVGPQGEDGDSEWSRLELINGCLRSMGLLYEDYISDFQSLVLKYSNKSILLTNLYDSDSGVLQNTSITDQLESSSVVSTIGAKYKLKIYNADEFGKGNHVHLLNTRLATVGVNSNEYLCQSGFTISNDITSVENEECLNVIGQRNSSISGHNLTIRFIDDKTDFKRVEDGDWLRIVIENLNPSTLKGNTFLVKQQTADNITRIPDRTGWNAVWEDTNDDAETWEVVYRDEILNGRNEISIDAISYNRGGNTNNEKFADIADDSTLPVAFTDNSYVRFKRMNNWALVDYRIELYLQNPTDSIVLKNIVFKINKPTLACRTISWYPGTFMTEDIIDWEIDSYFHHFKIESARIEGEKTFKILNKFSFSPLIFDAERQRYFVSGQIWATIEDYDPVCEKLQIVPI